MKIHSWLSVQTSPRVVYSNDYRIPVLKIHLHNHRVNFIHNMHKASWDGKCMYYIPIDGGNNNLKNEFLFGKIP